ncbi:MAG: molybdopterin synthase sulfur carrier subunit [Candidatus Thorarchaeota archaeon]|nr:MAG: molybdopterin synthase sulfur carrier subunit [Candidatus Thorarchaeota archaeon]
MKVKVKFFAHLSELTGKKPVFEVDVEEGATVSMLLDSLLVDRRIRDALLDENQEIRSNITVLKNGREIKLLAGMETKLSHGDELAVFPMLVGGR